MVENKIYKLKNGTIANADHVMSNYNVGLKASVVSTLNGVKSSFDSGYSFSEPNNFKYSLFDSDVATVSNFTYNSGSDWYEAGVGGSSPAVLETPIHSVDIGSYTVCTVPVGSFHDSNSLDVYGSLDAGSNYVLMNNRGDMTELGYGSDLRLKFVLIRNDTTEIEYLTEYGVFYG